MSLLTCPERSEIIVGLELRSGLLPSPHNPVVAPKVVVMLSPSNLSAKEFAELKYTLPEAGRWHELHDGQTVLLSAPDDVHGTVILNITRALAEWFQMQPPKSRGYACHDLGLHVHSDPDTVYVPSVSIFREGKMFGQFDNVIATEVPTIVIDVASSNDRRRDMRLRTSAYMHHGVECVWVPDPFKKEIQVIRNSKHTLALGKWQTLNADDLLPGFTMSVESVFQEPKWWDGRLPETDL